MTSRKYLVRAVLVFLPVLLIGACALPQPEARKADYVYGWTGIETMTSNVNDPYVEGMFRSSCPVAPVPGVTCVALLVNPRTYENAVLLVVYTKSASNPQVEANELMAQIGAPMGCNLGRTEPTLSAIGYSYGYAACGNKDGFYPAAIVSNRWGRAFSLMSLRRGSPPSEADLREMLESVRFPA